METKEKFDIFISYKRISLPTANNLYYRLTTKGYSTFFDLEEMRNDDFDKQLLHYIGNAKDVFVILEEHSLDACKDGTWETDWFCREIIFALEQNKHIIPILLNGYEMPKEEDLPDKLKRLTKQDAPKFDFAYFSEYIERLIRNNRITSKPNKKDIATSVFKFYANEQTQIYKEGKLVCSLDKDADEPYYLPVARKGDYRFKGVNVVTDEQKILDEYIDADEEKKVEIKWDRNQMDQPKIIVEEKSKKINKNLLLPSSRLSPRFIAKIASFLSLIVLFVIIVLILKVEDIQTIKSRLIINNNVKEFLVNNVSFDMIEVKGDTFLMGTNDILCYPDEHPIHKVYLSSYYIGETEVTQELWQAVMGDNPSINKGDKMPVDNVSWNDCQRFIAKLNKLTNTTFRLPTEAEWEYAAQGGNRSKEYTFAGNEKIDRVAWYEENSGAFTHPVATKKPNKLGLYDMSGNVWEWCIDKYSKNYYENSPLNNPQLGASYDDGSYRVRRGGSAYDGINPCRVTFRSRWNPNSKNERMGFRLVLSI